MRKSEDHLERFLAQLPGDRLIDLGCGRKKARGAHGVDAIGFEEVDQIIDLDAGGPWPLEDGAYHGVILRHVIEHLASIPDTLAQVLRICADGALVYIETPHYTSSQSWGDPTHRWHLSTESFDCFIGDEPPTFEFLSCHVTLRHSLLGRLGYEWALNRVNHAPRSAVWRWVRHRWETKRSFTRRGRNLYFVLQARKR